MSRGQPDFGMYAVKEIGASLADMADLAVRLGSIVEYDRRGDVIYLDDFEAPIQKYEESGAAGCTAKLDSEAVLSGAQSCKFSLAGAIGDYAQAFYYLSPMVTGKHGIKIATSLHEMHLHNSYYEIGAIIHDGSYRHNLSIQLNPKQGTLKYENPAGAMVTFEDAFSGASPYPRAFSNMKLVFDLDTGKYVRFLFDVLEWDISAYSFGKLALVTTPYAHAWMYIWDLEGYAFTIWQDNFVYTINEP